MLSDNAKVLLKKKFEGLTDKVSLITFTQEFECRFCKETRELVLDIAAASPLIEAKVLDFVKDAGEAKRLRVNKIPAIAITGKKDYGIRYYGVPAGFELPVLVDDIIDVSRGATTLPATVKARLAEIKKPVHIQVFVSPTCPYCPAAIRTSHQLAIENTNIRTDVVEISEFVYLAQKYSVMGTPKVVINEDTSFTGAQPPEFFIEQMLAALRTSFNPMYS
ncbi:MAG TPA: glutaredoxin [Candidatus Methanoperedenaceae archaeon]|nr:glutaredoxin [Candidatus Methanoperedenaceae archaeon]